MHAFQLQISTLTKQLLNVVDNNCSYTSNQHDFEYYQYYCAALQIAEKSSHLPIEEVCRPQPYPPQPQSTVGARYNQPSQGNS